MLLLLIIIVCLILQFFLPWWVIGLAAFLLAAWKAKSTLQAFSSGFFALFILWTGMCLIHSIPNQHLLAGRVGQMLGLPDQSFTWTIVLLITSILGGLAAGFSALAGFLCRKLLVNPR